MNQRTASILQAAVGTANTIHVRYGTLRRLEEMPGGDPLADFALRVTAQLLADLPGHPRQRAGIVIGTHHGCVEMDRQFDASRREQNGRYASPAAFSRTLPSTVMAEIALRFNIQGPGLVVSAGPLSTVFAIRRALAWMHAFDLEHCITGGMDWHAGSREVALLLLSRGDALPLVTLLDGKPSATNTLVQLSEWVCTGRNMILANSVLLQELTADR